MTDKVLCPYCENEMVVIISIYLDSPGWVGQTLCPGKGCNALGPRVTGYKTKAAAKAAALAAAQARYLPPNRPLTLDEVKALDRDDMGYSCVWMENRRVYDANGQAYEDYPYPVVTAECVPSSQAYYKKYGIEYRVWLRKPTQAEMDAVHPLRSVDPPQADPVTGVQKGLQTGQGTEYED